MAHALHADPARPAATSPARRSGPVAALLRHRLARWLSGATVAGFVVTLPLAFWLIHAGARPALAELAQVWLACVCIEGIADWAYRELRQHRRQPQRHAVSVTRR